MKTHGLKTTYNYGCRCCLCMLAHRFVMQDFYRRRAGKKAQPAKTAAWREAVEQQIVRDQADVHDPIREYDPLIRTRGSCDLRRGSSSLSNAEKLYLRLAAQVLDRHKYPRSIADTLRKIADRPARHVFEEHT